MGADDIQVGDDPAELPVLVDDREVAEPEPEHDPGHVVDPHVRGGRIRPGPDDLGDLARGLAAACRRSSLVLTKPISRPSGSVTGSP